MSISEVFVRVVGVDEVTISNNSMESSCFNILVGSVVSSSVFLSLTHVHKMLVLVLCKEDVQSGGCFCVFDHLLIPCAVRSNLWLVCDIMRHHA